MASTADEENDLNVCYVTSYKEHFVNKSSERNVEKIYKRCKGQRSQQSNKNDIFGKFFYILLVQDYFPENF